MENAKFEYYAINDLPVYSFLTEFDDSGDLGRSDSKLYGMLSDEIVYDFMRKVMVLSSCLSENVDSGLKITLKYAAEKCVFVEFVFEQCSSLLSYMQEKIKFFVTSLPDLCNCSFHTYIQGRSGRMQETSVLPCINHDDIQLLAPECSKELYAVAVRLNEKQREELGLIYKQVYELLTHCAFKEVVLPNGTAKRQRISYHQGAACNGGGNDGGVGGSRGNGPGGGAGAGGDGDGDGAGAGGDGAGAGGGGGGGPGGGANFLNIPIFLRTPGNPLQQLGHILLFPDMNRDQVLTALHHLWCNYANEQPRQNITRETVWPGHRVIFRGLLNVYKPDPVEEDYVELDFEGDWASFHYRIEHIIVEPLAV